MESNIENFDERKGRFFAKYGIKINPKTRKWNKEFYVAHNEFRLGRTPPPSILDKQNKIHYLCKFCLSPLNETKHKGHNKEFCNSRCQQNYFQTRKTFEKLHNIDEDISMLIRYPQKEKPEEELSKTKPIKKNQMDVSYNDLSKKPYSNVVKKGRPTDL